MRASAAFERSPRREALLDWLEGRFGMPREAFDEYVFWHRAGVRGTWLASAGAGPVQGFGVDAVGVALTRDLPPRSKPSSVFLQKLGHLATRNVVLLSEADAERFLRREDLDCDQALWGYVVVRTLATVLGCGQAREGRLESLIPRSWVAGLVD